MTYNSVRTVDLLQLLSNVPGSIGASIVYDDNFIVDFTKIKYKFNLYCLDTVLSN